MAESTTGRFLWYQINTTDEKKSIDFYSSVVGWEAGVFEAEGKPDYPLLQRGDQAIGGVMGMPPEAVASGAPSHWLIYIGTDDLDATLQKAVEAGAKVFVPPMDIPVGRFAVLGDPWGAMFAIYWQAEAPGPEKDAEVGEISWHEISTDDLEASWSFYSSLFGWDNVADHDMGEEMGTYRLFGRHGRQLGGMYRRPPEMPVNAWTIYVRVEDVVATLEKANAAGAETVVPPMEVPGGDHIAVIKDPQGAMFAFHSKG